MTFIVLVMAVGIFWLVVHMAIKLTVQKPRAFELRVRRPSTCYERFVTLFMLLLLSAINVRLFFLIEPYLVCFCCKCAVLKEILPEGVIFVCLKRCDFYRNLRESICAEYRTASAL